MVSCSSSISDVNHYCLEASDMLGPCCPIHYVLMDDPCIIDAFVNMDSHSRIRSGMVLSVLPDVSVEHGSLTSHVFPHVEGIKCLDLGNNIF